MMYVLSLLVCFKERVVKTVNERGCIHDKKVVVQGKRVKPGHLDESISLYPCQI